MTRRLAVVAVLICAGVLAAGASASASCGPPSLKMKGEYYEFCCTHPSSRTFVIRNTGGRRSGVLKASLAFDPAAPGQAFAITKDACTGRSLRPQRQCSVELTWLAGADSLVTLTVGSNRTQVSSPQMIGYAVP